MNKVLAFLKKFSVEIVLLILVALFGIARPDTFLKINNIIPSTTHICP